MPDVPWTITRSKRKSNEGTSTPRKRTERRHDATARGQQNSVSRPQQTLTQIAFVTSSSCEDEDEAPLVDLEPLPTDSPQPAAFKPARVLKRDSTLTQMDFGSSFGASGGPRASSMRPPAQKVRKRSKKRDSTLTQMDFFHGNMDGGNDFDDTMLTGAEDVVSEPRASTPIDSPANRTPQTPARINTLNDVRPIQAQEHRPGKRKRIDDHEQQGAARRRSSRIAATSPAVSTTPRAVATTASHSGRRRAPATVLRKPLLEIQDSTEFFEVPVEEITILQAPQPVNPSTPVRTSQRILSSQTPESVHGSTARRVVSPPKSDRRPLSELSTNIRRSTRKSIKGKVPTMSMIRKSALKKSPPRKICILKLPRHALTSLDRELWKKDSAQDIYSLQATSSIPKSEHGSTHGRFNLTTPTSRNSGSSGPTIKETASSQRNPETQDSLPDISEIIGIHPVTTIEATEELPVTDPTTPTRPEKCLSQKLERRLWLDGSSRMLPDSQPLNMIPELETVTTDELPDFGSPVANDTQFMENLHEQLSSPVVLSHADTNLRATTVPRTSNRSPSSVRGLSRASLPGLSSRKSPLPAPRLVSKNATQTLPRQTTRSSSIRAMASLSTQNRSSENVRISFVPLNDTLEYQQRSSSPALPPAPLSSTQESAQLAQLASIPHPSQVSTQAPSQGYLPSSSAPQTFPLPQDSEVERIVIKDSSSFPARLSQIDHHLDESELEGDLDLFEDSQDEDDLDLDPSTFQSPTPNRKTTQTRTNEDITQTPTQKSQRLKISTQTRSSTQSSPVITNATTRSQRDARLEVVALTSSSSPTRPPHQDTTPKPQRHTPHKRAPLKGKSKQPSTRVPSPPPPPPPPRDTSPPLSSLSSSLYSPSPPRDLKRKYSPLEGFNNDTQSDFTQGGSVTAAYVHRMWERGDLPRSFVPRPYKVKGGGGRGKVTGKRNSGEGERV